jgi:hypothetical protein
MTRPSDLLNQGVERKFTPEEEEQKRHFYEKISLRRRRFVDRIGYENWDPFAGPKEPMYIRKDLTQRTAEELVREFMKATVGRMHGGEYARGVTACAVGIVAGQEKYQGVLDFCVWYHELLQKEKLSK